MINAVLRYLILSGFVFAIDTVFLYSSTVTIRGESSEYKGETLTFSTYSNMISFTEKELGSCEVNDSGEFNITLELNQTRLIFTRLGVYNCYLFAQPGMDYRIRLPARLDKTLNDQVNPYFEEKSVHLYVNIAANDGNFPRTGPEEELNFLIRAFNDSFYPYYYKLVINAYGNQIDNKEIRNTIKTLTEPFDSAGHPFFNDYMKFRIGLLDHYGRQTSSRQIIEDYFLDSKVAYFNPAYMELFNEIFQDYFEQLAGEHPNRQLPALLNREKDLSALQNILLRDASLVNDTLRELVLLKGLYDGFYDQNYIRASMLQLLDSLRINTSISYISGIIGDVMQEITRLLPGFKPVDFSLKDSEGNLVHLSDFYGSFVYLNFCNSFSYYCIKEYEYLKILRQRMSGKNLKIITILVDDSYEMMKELVRNNNYPWTFLHFSNQPEVLENFDIRSYPEYFLIGPEGKMLLSPAPSPMENFEKTFLRILETR